jgi:hypothetical protein
MRNQGQIYTVHEKEDALEATKRIVFVREGFAFWALVFNLFWLLAHGCWRMSAIYFVMLVVLAEAGKAAGLTEPAVMVLQFGLHFWLAGIANDCRRAALARSGYEEIDIVAAESELLATRRYYDRQPHPALAA